MATQRYISTSFWTDKWIRTLDPSQRYLYLYLLTNPQTNIAGVYQITLDRIAFDTGYDERTLIPMLKKFDKEKKAHFYNDEWIIIPSWPKHQRITQRDNNKKGIDAILRDLPDDVWYFLVSAEYEYKFLADIGRPLKALEAPCKPLTSPLKPLTRPSNYSDTDTDTDTDKNSAAFATGPVETLPEPVEKPKPAVTDRKPMSPMKDPVAQHYQEKFTERVPGESWANIAKERAQLSNLAKNTKRMLQYTPYESDIELADAVLEMYDRMKQTTREKYIRDGPWTPTGLITRWDQVIESLRQNFVSEEEIIF